MAEEKENKFYGLEEAIRREYKGKFVTDNDVELDLNFDKEGFLTTIDLNLTPNNTTSFVIKDVQLRVAASFIDVLMDLLNKDGRDNAEIYNSVSMDRKTFSKILQGKSLSKKNLIKLAIALKLNLEQTKELLASASFAFDPSKKLDIVVIYAIENGYYDPHEIEEALYACGEHTLFYIE